MGEREGQAGQVPGRSVVGLHFAKLASPGSATDAWSVWNERRRCYQEIQESQRGTMRAKGETMNIPLASEPYWDYYDALAAVIDRILTLADGGQLKNFGTDIQSPELVERAKSTIAQF